jgi:hypothetical protein
MQRSQAIQKIAKMMGPYVAEWMRYKQRGVNPSAWKQNPDRFLHFCMCCWENPVFGTADCRSCRELPWDAYCKKKGVCDKCESYLNSRGICEECRDEHYVCADCSYA